MVGRPLPGAFSLVEVETLAQEDDLSPLIRTHITGDDSSDIERRKHCVSANCGIYDCLKAGVDLGGCNSVDQDSAG